MPVHEKARAEGLLADTRTVLAGDAPTEKLRSLTEDMRQLTQSLTGRTPDVEPVPAGVPAADGDVVDAEFDRS